MTGFQSKRQASKALLQQALDTLLCCSPDHKAGAALQIKTVAELRAHLAEPAVDEPLTDKQMDQIMYDCGLSLTARDIARAIEAAHGIKEGT